MMSDYEIWGFAGCPREWLEAEKEKVLKEISRTMTREQTSVGNGGLSQQFDNRLLLRKLAALNYALRRLG